MIEGMVQKFKERPLRIYFLVQSFLTLFIVFGLALTADQVGAVLGVTNILLWILTDSAVVPIAERDRQVEEALNTPPPANKDEV